MQECTGLARVDRLLTRLAQLDTDGWLALAEEEGRGSCRTGHRATAELLAGAVIAHQGLAFREWLAADAVETLVQLAGPSGGFRLASGSMRMADAKRVARRALAAELARDSLPRADYQLLIRPVRAVLARYSPRPR